MDNKLLELFFKSVGDCLFLILVETDGTFHFDFVNDAFLEVTGLPEEKILRKPIEEVIPPESLALVLSKYREALKENKTVRWEEISNFPTGKRYGEVTITPIIEETSGQTFLVGAVHDITALREEQEVVRNNKVFLRTLLQNFPNGWVCVFDRDLRYLFSEGKGLELINGSPDQMLGKSLDELYPPADAEYATRYFNKALAGETVSFEVPINDFTFQINASPLYDESGEINSVLAQSNNITEQKKLDEDLRKSQTQLSAIFNNARDMIYLTDAEARFVEVNPRTCELLGYSRDELLKLTIWDITPPANREDGKELRNLLISSGSLSGEYLLIRKDGTLLNVEFNSITNILPGLHLSFIRDITERKRIEQSRRESEQRYRSIISNAPINFFVIDKKGIFTFSEGSILESIGLKPGELVGQPALELYKDAELHEDSGKIIKVIDVFNRVLSGETIKGYLKVEERYFENTLIPIYDAEHEISGLMGVAFNITEIKVAEENLRASEEKFRSMIEHSADIVSLHDLSGKMTYQSPSIKRILGYDQNELLGLDAIDFIHPDFQAFSDAEANKIRSKGGIHPSFTTKFRHKNGSWLWFECYGNNQLDNPSIGHVIFSAHDITQRKEAEEKLRESEMTFSSVVKSINQGLIITDLEDNVFYINERLTELTGFTFEEMKGKPAYEFLLPPEKWENILNRNQDRSRGTSETYEHQILRKDKSSFWAESIASPFRNADGEIVGTVGILADITEWKESQDKLNKTQEQLRAAQKLESIGMLAGGIAHDFNNMLTAINGYSDLILRQLDDNDPLRHKVEEIRKAGDRAAELTYQLLAFSRKQVLQPKSININETINEVMKLLKHLIGENIVIDTFLDQNLGTTKIDPGQFAQVIINLSINARDAMPEGGKLVIETDNIYLDENYAQKHGTFVIPGRYVMMAISDNGIGIDDKTKLRIFEPFFTTKDVGKGTGMGLATVYGIVKQSGGNIWLYSEIGQGSTFKIYLPRVDQEAEIQTDLIVDDDLPIGTENILLVEDEEMVRSVTKQILEMCGYSVIEASNGAEAVKICAEIGCDIDLLITDVVMPVMGGRELVKTLSETNPALRVLYISGYTDNAIVHHGILNKGTMFLQKPFTPESLARKVRDCLDTPSKNNE